MKCRSPSPDADRWTVGKGLGLTAPPRLRPAFRRLKHPVRWRRDEGAPGHTIHVLRTGRDRHRAPKARDPIRRDHSRCHRRSSRRRGAGAEAAKTIAWIPAANFDSDPRSRLESLTSETAEPKVDALEKLQVAEGDAAIVPSEKLPVLDTYRHAQGCLLHPSEAPGTGLPFGGLSDMVKKCAFSPTAKP